MSRRLLSIPLLCLVLLHAVLGAGRGESVICFGGHDHHHHDSHHDSHHGSVHDAADHAVHPCGLPGAIPVAYLTDCCTCADVLIDLQDLHPPDRDDTGIAWIPGGPGPDAVFVASIGIGPPDRGRPPRPPVVDPDPARRHHLAVLGVTRLLT